MGDFQFGPHIFSFQKKDQDLYRLELAKSTCVV